MVLTFFLDLLCDEAQVWGLAVFLSFQNYASEGTHKGSHGNAFYSLSILPSQIYFIRTESLRQCEIVERLCPRKSKDEVWLQLQWLVDKRSLNFSEPIHHISLSWSGLRGVKTKFLYVSLFSLIIALKKIWVGDQYIYIEFSSMKPAYFTR